MAPPRKTTVVEHVNTLAEQWARHLRSRNRSPKTIQSYLESLDRLERHLRAEGLSDDVNRIGRQELEGFINAQLQYHAPATAALRFRSLKQFFRWATDEGIIPISPFERMKEPKVPDVPVDVIPDEYLRKLLATCETPGRAPSRKMSAAEFENRRDYAILRLFIDTPMRLSEMTNLVLDGPEGPDIDMKEGLVRIFGKGSKVRINALGDRSLAALDTYLRVRKHHPRADLPWLWIGMHGQITPNGIAQMLNRRTKAAGLPHIHPHQFRHTFAHVWLNGGGNEGDLMEIAGWSSRDMLRRYARSTAAARAQAAAKRRNVGGRV